MVEAMEIKGGFKQTEVGVIPSDWEVVKLDEVCELTSSKRIFESEYVPAGIPFYRGKEISILIENKKLDDEYFIPESRYEEIKRQFGAPEKNDVLITAVGTLGNVYLIPDDKKFYFKDGNLIWLRKIKNINSKYLSIQIGNHKRNIISNAIGSSQKALTIVVLKNQPIPLPPTKAEQTAIATALNDADALITQLEKLIAKKRAIKQGAMQELLKPKEGWEVKKLGEVCDYQNGTSLEKYFNSEAGFAVISIGNYSPLGKFVVTHTFIDKKLESIINKFILKRNELTMILNDKTSVGNIIGRVLLIEEDNKYVFNQRTMRLKPKKGIVPYFLYHLINSDEVHNKFVAESKPGTQIYLNTNDVIEMEITIPKTIAEQTRIANIVSDMDAEIEALEKKLNKYKMIKQGMMQNLLTGRIRLV